MLPVAATLAIMALAMLFVGLRGRVIDDHPVCRRCRFDLIGLSPEQCPECGADLGRPRAVRTGNRVRLKRLSWLGVVVLAGAGILTGATMWGSARKFNWNTIKPTWLLMTETRFGSSSRAEEAAAELGSRLAADKLPPDQIGVLVERGLRIQADRSIRWAAAWGDLLEAAWTKNLLTDEQKRAFIRNAVLFQFNVRPKIEADQLCGVEMVVSADRVGGRLAIDVAPTCERLAIGEKVLTLGMSSSSVGVSRGGVSSMRHAVKLPVGPGAYKVRSEWIIRASIQNEAATQWPVTLESPVEVVGADQATVRLVTDPSLRAAVAKCFSSRRITIDSSGHLSGDLTVTNPPTDMAFQIIARAADGREWRVGDFVCRANPTGSTRHSTMFGADIPGMDAAVVRLLLRPDGDTARRTPYLVEIWGEEVELAPMPVQRQGAGG